MLLPVALGIGAALLILLGVVVVVSMGDDDEASSQVTLERVNYSPSNGFFDNLDLALAVGDDNVIADDLVSQMTSLGNWEGLGSAGEGNATLAGATTNGGEPGLYGGSREEGVCDVDQLVDFLTDPENADRAAAWADVLGVGVDEIETYVDGLTPVRLRMDTRVTNHGFENGEPVPFQAVLQAGTAVLVDNTGQPVVKCNCGNPLSAPESGGTSDDLESVATNPDAAWETLDPSQVVVIEEAEAVLESVVIVDTETGGLLERPVGSDGTDDRGTGEFQATLEWDSPADLDLHVTDPSGEEIYYANREPAGSGGQLDRDANVGCPTGDPAPVENVFWNEGDAPPGEYTVEVHGFSVGGSGCGSGSYTLTISVFGQEDVVHTGEVADGDWDSYTVTLQ